MSKQPDSDNRWIEDAVALEQRAPDRREAAFDATRAAAAIERRLAGDRRKNRFRNWRRINVGGLPVAVVDTQESAKAIVDEALERRGLWRYPAYITSTNGEVTSRVAFDEQERSLFLEADAIHADGMPHVFASRMKCEVALPERVATTDLFFDVAAEACSRGATMFLLGATEVANNLAVERIRAQFPGIKLVGHRHGFFADEQEEIAACAEIAALQPDILWVSMGVPREQMFVVRHRSRLTSVGVIKTSGGLFDFLSGLKPRAPQWMQAIGLEWLWRAALEPKRLGWRYLKTNPMALYLLLTKSK
ncbi:WecB/TagA/CpsF family glycosyltransferase [Rhodopseudomonas palustris]|uniref:Glycosyl transferase, WecB/TagA/CpsF family n=1 Tax=Rhodopseudomonas palustris (strain BisB18) TaxID=316056 RepID=Q21BI9_RHOPB